MGRKRRAFSTEFKVEAIRRAGERRARSAALTGITRELGITADLLRRWTRELGDASPQSVTSQQELEAENRRLRRESDVPRQERALRSKAVTDSRGQRNTIVANTYGGGAWPGLDVRGCHRRSDSRFG